MVHRHAERKVERENYQSLAIRAGNRLSGRCQRLQEVRVPRTQEFRAKFLLEAQLDGLGNSVTVIDVANQPADEVNEVVPTGNNKFLQVHKLTAGVLRKSGRMAPEDDGFSGPHGFEHRLPTGVLIGGEVDVDLGQQMSYVCLRAQEPNLRQHFGPMKIAPRRTDVSGPGKQVDMTRKSEEDRFERIQVRVGADLPKIPECRRCRRGPADLSFFQIEFFPAWIRCRRPVVSSD